MKMEHILSYAKTLIKLSAQEGSIVIDGTVGNGHDTAFLANLVGNSGKVFGFDIQKDAIERTTEKLTAQQLIERVTLYHAGHELMNALLPNDVHQKIDAAIFNLGYLPKGDKSIVTKPDTTIDAIQQLLGILSPGGIIVLVVYHGHPGGKAEKDALIAYVENISQDTAHVLQYRFMNQQNDPPFIVAIEKRIEK